MQASLVINLIVGSYSHHWTANCVLFFFAKNVLLAIAPLRLNQTAHRKCGEREKRTQETSLSRCTPSTTTTIVHVECIRSAVARKINFIFSHDCGFVNVFVCVFLLTFRKATHGNKMHTEMNRSTNDRLRKHTCEAERRETAFTRSVDTTGLRSNRRRVNGMCWVCDAVAAAAVAAAAS